MFRPNVLAGLSRVAACLAVAGLVVLLVVPAEPLAGVDEAAKHAGAFFAAGLLVALALRSARLAVLVMVALAVSAGLAQALLPERQPSLIDLASGAAGALAAVALVWLWLRGATALRSVAATATIVACASAIFWLSEGTPGRATISDKALHYTVNHSDDFPAAAAIGFNLADVSSVAALDALPPGTKGILWMRNGYDKTCAWQRDDAGTAEIAREARDHPNFSGIYFIADTPHPSVCPDAPQRIAERTALIKANDPDGRTFIAVSGGYKYQEEFHQLADAADLIGIVVYPCNTKKPRCEIDKIRERAGRAFDAGIPPERLVPVFQAFGQACSTNEEKYYRLPEIDELQEILALWDELLPRETRPFDMTYSWGEQERHACPSLATADGDRFPDLRSVYARYFAATGL